MDHLGGCHLYKDYGDRGTWCPEVWDWLIFNFPIKSVIDVGCGGGYAINYIRNQHNLKVRGIEGYEEAFRHSPIPEYMVKHDYTLGPYEPECIFDLGWCCEFVEHVEEKFIPNFMATLAKCKFVAMTHGLPGSEFTGFHHVNCRGESYWIELFKQYGFEHWEEDSRLMRLLLLDRNGNQLDHGGHVATTVKLFKNEAIN